MILWPNAEGSFGATPSLRSPCHHTSLETVHTRSTEVGALPLYFVFLAELACYGAPEAISYIAFFLLSDLHPPRHNFQFPSQQMRTPNHIDLGDMSRCMSFLSLIRPSHCRDELNFVLHANPSPYTCRGLNEIRADCHAQPTAYC